jgi:hypothetical protein
VAADNVQVGGTRKNAPVVVAVNKTQATAFINSTIHAAGKLDVSINVIGLGDISYFKQHAAFGTVQRSSPLVVSYIVAY